ncbi:MAG: pyridoxal phosphate-dependent aminotransferase, partial [Chloroflexota bacterium]|nr:pyridoxal phosphate-dependent aminotransferase [Chloroflexota bacterium]
MPISSKLQKQMSEGGWIRKMFEQGIALKRKYGEENVFDFSLGNPIIEPPDAFRGELRKWADKPLAGMHRYMPNAGYPETRTAVAQYLSNAAGMPFGMNDIVMTCGAAGGLNVALKTVVEAGDEVIIFSPYFVEYIYYIDNVQGVPVIVPTDERFLPDIAALEKGITPKTKAVIINSPNNPTGAVYGGDVLKGIGDVLQRKESEYGTEIYLISDDIYRRLAYDGVDCPYVFEHHQQSIVVTSYSKDLALPGERIGYIAVNPQCEGRDELVAGMVFCNRTLGFVNAPALMQNVVRDLQESCVDISQYEKKRDMLCDGLSDMGYSLVKPQGAFYIFPQSPVEDDMAF